MCFPAEARHLFYSSDQYVSKDLDLINTNFAKRREIKSVMEGIGFQERGRYFKSRDVDFSVEFPDGPLSVGEEPVREISEFELTTGTLRVVSAADCVKDRLCAYYYLERLAGIGASRPGCYESERGFEGDQTLVESRRKRPRVRNLCG